MCKCRQSMALPSLCGLYLNITMPTSNIFFLQFLDFLGFPNCTLLIYYDCLFSTRIIQNAHIQYISSSIGYRLHFLQQGSFDLFKWICRCTKTLVRIQKFIPCSEIDFSNVKIRAFLNKSCTSKI